MVSDDDKFVHLFPQGNGKGNHWFSAPLELPISGPLKFTQIASDDSDYSYVTSDENQVYVHTNFGAPKYRLVRVDLKSPDRSNWVDILPEHKSNVLSAVEAVDGDKLAALYVQNVSHVIQVHNLADGAYIANIETPLGVNVQGFSAKRNGTELLYKLVSFLNPGIIVKYDFKSGEKKVRIN